MSSTPTQTDPHTSPTPIEYAIPAPSGAINPWLFVPVLYFMQSLPNILVTETFGTAYKNLGVDNLQIALWTGLAALPWSFKMFWAPLVDLSFTKRQWTLAMQVLLTGVLILSAVLINTPAFFALTVAALFLMATCSATHDIACDGLYLMSLDKKRQAAFSGVMATFSRLGRLFAASLLVAFAGWIGTAASIGSKPAWAVALGLGALVYGAGMLWNFFALPRPAADVPAADVAPGERSRNIVRTLTVIALGVAAYYLINGAIQLTGHTIYHHVAKGTVPANWDQTGEVTHEWAKIAIGVVLVPTLLLIARWQLTGTPMGDAFVSYARQRGFAAILGFIIFYRFGEAMIFAMAKLFLLDSRDKGGMGIGLAELGAVMGIGQVFGLILGGLSGGWFISRMGLRKAFWPLVLCMHTPNLLYVWLALKLPAHAWAYPAVFAEAFGYGFGFAGYFVFLMQVAQRGRYTTSHYAIGTGLGALFITFAFITAGIVQSVFGYIGVFVAACLFTIPGTLTLLFIPLDNEASKSIQAPAAGH